MTFDELSVMAYNHTPLLPYMTLYEVSAYFGLESIYWSYEHHFISKEQAVKKKEEIRHRFEAEIIKDNDSRKLFERTDNIRVAFGGQFKKVEQSGCPICKNLVRILDGRHLIESQNTGGEPVLKETEGRNS